ncbi:hypothetical protein D3C80_1877910 [compost metagenome]
MQRLFQPLWVAFIRLVGGEHIVVGGDDGDIAAHHVFQGGFIVGLAGGKAVGQVATG